jgi:hypothetical protein
MAFQVRKILQRCINGMEGLWHTFSGRLYRIGQRKPWSFGYSAYKYDAIADFISSPDFSGFKGRSLPDAHGYRTDERFVEYPWFFSRLKNSEKIILDAGSVLNHRQILALPQLADRKLYISTLFYEGRPEILPSPSYLYEDLRNMCFKDGFFDAVCCLSTLEHVGLDNTKLYSPNETDRENDKYSHLKAVSEMHRVLKPGGSLYLSLPYGIYKNHGWFQVFDGEMIQRIVDTFAPERFSATYFRYENDQWNFSNEDACKDGTCFDIHATKQYEPDYLAFARCVVCLELTKGAP